MAGHSVSQSTRPRVGPRSNRATAAVLLPLVGLALVIAAWWMATDVFGVRPIIVPSPQSVLGELIDRPQFLAKHATVTLTQTLVGFSLMTVVGIVIGAAIANSMVVDQMVSPWLVALNAVPKVALAPLLVVWFGFGMGSRVAMVALLCFFPIVLATATGLKSTPSELVELSRSLDASRWQTFVKVRFPYALPQIFVGLKVAMPLAAVGSVVGEFRGNDGLGQVIVRATATLDTKLSFAAIVVVSAMSVMLYYALVLVERLVLPWVRETTG